MGSKSASDERYSNSTFSDPSILSRWSDTASLPRLTAAAAGEQRNVLSKKDLMRLHAPFEAPISCIPLSCSETASGRSESAFVRSLLPE
jgi:hypothetical protein